jgi:outer membrane lipoprotein-sorting protein
VKAVKGTEVKDPEALKRIAAQAVPENMDLWPAIRSRLESRRAPAGPSREGQSWTRESARRGLWVGVAAVVVFVLVAGAIFQPWSRPESASAEAILDHALSSSNGPATVHTYHLVMTRQVPGKGNATVNTEIWYGGPDRQRRDERTSDPSGATNVLQQNITSGPQMWLAITSQGKTQVVHTTGTVWYSLEENPSQQHSLTDLMAQYSDKACMTATLQGDGSVAGQATYVILLSPKPGGCGPVPSIGSAKQIMKAGANGKGVPDGTTGAAAGAEAQADAKAAQAKKQAIQSGQEPHMRVWVDKVSFLPLKTEMRDANGTLMDRSEVTSVEYNVAIPDAVFTYTAPAGAEICNFSGGTGADVKRQLRQDSKTGVCPPPAPAKKP